MQTTLEPINQLLIVLYFVVLLAFSFVKKSNNKVANYLLAARKLTLIPFVATLVTTAYGWILGTGQLYYTYGYAAWLFLNLPYTLCSLVFAFYFSKKLHSQHLTTMPDLLEKHYNKHIATLGAMFVMVFTSPAMYVLMAAQVIGFIWQLPFWLCLLMAAFFSVVYIFKGGFYSVVKTDVLQFMLMFGGFMVVLFTLWQQHGITPIIDAQQQIVPVNTENSLWYIATWYVFATITLVDPNYHQRIHAAKDKSTAQKGMLLAVVCWIVFDFISASVALYALGLNVKVNNGSEVFLLMGANHLPAAVKGLFFIALLATILSTSNSLFFTSAVTLAKDILHRNKILVNIPVNKLTGWLMLLLALATTILLFPYKNSTAVDFFFDFTPYVVSGLLLPILSAYFTNIKLKPVQVFLQSVLAVFITAVAAFLKVNINEVFFGVGFALLYQLVVMGVKKINAS